MVQTTAGATSSSLARPWILVLKLILFPWSIWSAVRSLASRIGEALGRGDESRWVTTVAHGVLYLLLGLPVTLLLLGEVLISVNELLIGEQADYRIQSDFEGEVRSREVGLPGTPLPMIDPLAIAQPIPAARLVEIYAPVIVQKLAHHPEWDIPVSLEFDGNADPRDNVRSADQGAPIRASVYGELTAETWDSYYFYYGLYHIKDYDHPLRELITDWTYHDSDNEGLMMRVSKASMRVEQIESWYHNRFLLYASDGISSGSEPIHGAIHFEGGTHPLVYSQPQGHGVRLMQAGDLDALDRNVKILRPQLGRPAVHPRLDRSVEVETTYVIESFDDWYEMALGPFGEKGEGEGFFEEYIDLGLYPDGSPIRIGRYIAGWDYSKNGWSRPKPPWSWDDGWDQIPVFIWHFYPSFAFASHSGARLSHHYVLNHAVQKTFGLPAAEVLQMTDGHLAISLREGDKWEHLEERGGAMPHATYWAIFRIMLKAYANYLFHALG